MAIGDLFSEREKEILRVLGTKSMTIEQITEEVFEGKDNKPFDAHISIGNSIRRIIEKCRHYELKWVLGKSKRVRKIVYKKEML